MTTALFHLAGTEWLGGDDNARRVLQSCNDGLPVLDLGPTLGFPGLINSHDHLEFNCYPPLGSPPYADFTDWSVDVQRDHRNLIDAVEAVPRRARLQIGALKNLLWGVTSVAHHGGRMPSALELPVGIISNFDVVHSPELEQSGRLQFLKAWRRRPVAAHIGEATTAASRRRALDFARSNVFHRRLIGIHGVALEAVDFSRFDALVWCPGSNLNLLHKTLDAGSAKGETTVLFGTDATISAPGTLWDHLRAARRLGGLSNLELFESLTGSAARFWGLRDLRSDFVVARRREREQWDAFFSITPADILLVVCGGRAVLADETVVRAYPDIFGSLTPVGASQKRVAMDIDDLVSILGRSPGLDFAAMMSRFTGSG